MFVLLNNSTRTRIAVFETYTEAFNAMLGTNNILVVLGDRYERH